jgi:hypothetical protein
MAVSVETFADMNHPWVGDVLREVRNDLYKQAQSEKFRKLFHQQMVGADGSLKTELLTKTLVKTAADLTVETMKIIAETSKEKQTGGGKNTYNKPYTVGYNASKTKRGEKSVFSKYVNVLPTLEENFNNANNNNNAFSTVSEPGNNNNNNNYSTVSEPGNNINYVNMETQEYFTKLNQMRKARNTFRNRKSFVIPELSSNTQKALLAKNVKKEIEELKQRKKRNRSIQGFIQNTKSKFSFLSTTTLEFHVKVLFLFWTLQSYIASLLKKTLALPMRGFNSMIGYSAVKNINSLQTLENIQRYKDWYYDPRQNEKYIGPEINKMIDKLVFDIFFHALASLLCSMLGIGGEALQSLQQSFAPPTLPTEKITPIVKEGVGIINYVIPRPDNLPETEHENWSTNFVFDALNTPNLNMTSMHVLSTPTNINAMTNASSLLRGEIATEAQQTSLTKINEIKQKTNAASKLSQPASIPKPSIYFQGNYSPGLRFPTQGECPVFQSLPKNPINPAQFTNTTMNELAMIHAYNLYTEGGEFGFALVRDNKGNLQFVDDLVTLYHRSDTCIPTMGGLECPIKQFSEDIVALGHWHPFGFERLRSHPSFGDMNAIVQNMVWEKIPYHMVIAQEGRYLFHISGNITDLVSSLENSNDLFQIRDLMKRGLKEGKISNLGSLKEIYGNFLNCDSYQSGRFGQDIGRINYKGEEYSYGITVDFMNNKDSNNGNKFDFSLYDKFKGKKYIPLTPQKELGYSVISSVETPIYKNTKPSPIIPEGQFVSRVLETVYAPSDALAKPHAFRLQPVLKSYSGVPKSAITPTLCRTNATTLAKYNVPGGIPTARICQVSLCLENTDCSLRMFKQIKGTMFSKYWQIKKQVDAEYRENPSIVPSTYKQNEKWIDLETERRCLAYMNDHFQELGTVAIQNFKNVALAREVNPSIWEKANFFERIFLVLPGISILAAVNYKNVEGRTVVLGPRYRLTNKGNYEEINYSQKTRKNNGKNL